MKKVFLIRHGELEYPRNEKGEPLIYGSNTFLSSLGRKQIKDLAKKLKDKNIEIVFSSPFLRAVESAKILIKELPKKTPIKIIKNLRDVDVSGFVNKELTMDEFARVTKGGDSYSHQIFKKQEKLIDTCKRAITTFKKILETTEKFCFAIVSHGDFLSASVWMLEHKKSTSDYQKMKKYFYLEKGQAVLYEIDESLKIVKRVKLITIKDVKKSIEYWRK